MSVSAVPSEEEVQEQLGWEFEGLVVSQSRLSVGAPGEFPCIGEDGKALSLQDGDVVVIQYEAVVGSVEFKPGYKGLIQTKPRKRIHHAGALEGSQEIVGLRRRDAT